MKSTTECTSVEFIKLNESTFLVTFRRCPIIPDKKLAFVAIPKNAGTSIRMAFGVALGFIDEHDKVKDIHKKKWPGVTGKSNIRDLRNQGYFLFCVCRNPWERLVSLWQDKKNKKRFLRRHDGLFKAFLGYDFYPSPIQNVARARAL